VSVETGVLGLARSTHAPIVAASDVEMTRAVPFLPFRELARERKTLFLIAGSGLCCANLDGIYVFLFQDRNMVRNDNYVAEYRPSYLLLVQ